MGRGTRMDRHKFVQRTEEGSFELRYYVRDRRMRCHESTERTIPLDGQRSGLGPIGVEARLTVSPPGAADTAHRTKKTMSAARQHSPAVSRW